MDDRCGETSWAAAKITMQVKGTAVPVEISTCTRTALQRSKQESAISPNAGCSVALTENGRPGAIYELGTNSARVSALPNGQHTDYKAQLSLPT